MAYMTNPSHPAQPTTYCGASHHTTRTSTLDMSLVRFRRLPTGATAYGPMYAYARPFRGALPTWAARGAVIVKTGA